MVNFEDEDPGDDFEIEFSDLPADEMRSISGKLVTEGAHLWTRLSSVSSTLVLKGFRFLPMARTWLLSEVPEGSTKDDIELEIIDLSPGRFNGASNMLAALGSRLSPKVRLWRMILLACTVLLALLLILGSFPSARDWLNGLFVHLTPPLQTCRSRASPRAGVSPRAG